MGNKHRRKAGAPAAPVPPPQPERPAEPSDPDEAAAAHRQRGNASLKRGDARAAFDEFTAALKLAPGIAALHANRSAANARLGDWEGALDDARAAIAIEPRWAKAHVRCGCALYGLNRFAEAVSAYEEAASLEPDDPEAVQRALEDARRVAARSKLEAQLRPAVLAFAERKQAGAALLAERRYAEAEVEFTAALDGMGSLVGTLPDGEELGPLYEQLGSLRAAVEAELAQARAKAAAEPAGGVGPVSGASTS